MFILDRRLYLINILYLPRTLLLIVPRTCLLTIQSIHELFLPHSTAHVVLHILILTVASTIILVLGSISDRVVIVSKCIFILLAVLINGWFIIFTVNVILLNWPFTRRLAIHFLHFLLIYTSIHLLQFYEIRSLLCYTFQTAL